MQVKPDLFISRIGQDAQGQSAGQRDLLAIQVGRQVAGVGQHQLPFGAEPGGLAGGKALAAGQHAVQGGQNLRRASFRGPAQRSHQHGDVHRRLQPLAGHIADHNQQSAVACGLHVEEVAAHLRGRIVDRLHLEAWGFELLKWDHQLLHAARRGQFAGSPFLVPLYAQEPAENDDDNYQNANEIGDRGKVDGNGSGLHGERRAVLGAAQGLHRSSREHGLDPSHQGQQQRDQQ